MTRILLATLLAVGSGAALADCEFRAQRDLDLPAEGLKQLNLQTRAGDLRITGVAGLKQIELRGKACASAADTLELLQLQHNRNGSTIDVVTTSPDSNAGFSLFGSNYAYIDLEVRVPQSLDIKLADSSGDVEIRDVGALDVTDSSGDLRIDGARGDVSVNDSSGDIVLAQIDGSVSINDSSGDIDVDGVRRDVTVEDDSSGDIRITKIDGNARVRNDSSGDIRFRYIGGDAEVGSDSSGSIGADGVKGNFTVRNKSGGNRNISHSGVGGKVSLPERE